MNTDKLIELIEEARAAEDKAWDRLSKALRELADAQRLYLAARMQRVNTESASNAIIKAVKEDLK